MAPRTKKKKSGIVANSRRMTSIRPKKQKTLSHLQALPEELWVMVLQHVPKIQYPDLARVCKGLKDSVVRELYRFVEVPKRTRKQFYTQDDYQWSRVSNLDDFYDTMNSSPLLLPLIKHLSLDWRGHRRIRGSYSKNPNDVFSESGTLIQSSLETLHLSPIEWPMKEKTSSLITSLAIPASFLSSSPPLPDRSKYHAVFTLPRITTLSIYDIIDWNPFAKSSAIEYNSISKVTSLSLKTTEKVPTNGSDLVEILTWPKSLKSFHLCISSKECHPVHKVDPSSFVIALQPHLDCLEDLHIFSKCTEFPTMIDRSVDLKAFTALRRLSLPQTFLGRSQILSSQLEALQIEIPFFFSWSLKISSRLYRDRLSNQIIEAKTLFRDIVQHQKTQYPGLKRFMVLHCHPPLGYYTESDTNAKQFLSEVKNANIDFSLEADFEDSLFGGERLFW